MSHSLRATAQMVAPYPGAVRTGAACAEQSAISETWALMLVLPLASLRSQALARELPVCPALAREDRPQAAAHHGRLANSVETIDRRPSAGRLGACKESGWQ